MSQKMRIYHDIITMVLLISASALAIPVILKNPVYAQTDEIFKVQMSLFGINSTDSGDDLVTAFVSVNDVTKPRIINTTELDSEDSNGLDGIVESVPFSFPNITISIGEEFRACTFIFRTLNAFCGTGYNSPLNRVEYVSILIEEENEDDSN